MGIFHLWMLLKMWIQKKLTGILIFCCLIPDTNEAPLKYLAIINICLVLFQFAKPLPMPCLLQSPQQPWEFAKQFHWGYHSAVLNSQTSFPHGPYASQACHFTVLQTQHGFTLAWFWTCGSLCQESSPSLLCPTKEGSPHSGKPWAGRERPFTLGQQGRSSTLVLGAPQDGAHVSGRPAD